MALCTHRLRGIISLISSLLFSDGGKDRKTGMRCQSPGDGSNGPRSLDKNLRSLPLENVQYFTRSPAPLKHGGQARCFYCFRPVSAFPFKGAEREIRFSHPSLPGFLPVIQITNLPIGNLSADLEPTRTGSDVMINVTRKDDLLSIVTVR